MREKPYSILSKIVEQFGNVSAGMASYETLAGTSPALKKITRKKNRKKNKSRIY